MFVSYKKQYPESFALLFPRTLKLFGHKVCKGRLIFSVLYFF